MVDGIYEPTGSEELFVDVLQEAVEREVVASLIQQYTASSFDKYGEQSGTPIPVDLLSELSIPAEIILIRKKITTCERLLTFQQEDLFDSEDAGTIAVHEIQCLQMKVIQRYHKFGCLPFEREFDIMHSFCKHRNCGIASGIPLFAKACCIILYYINDIGEEIFSAGIALYTQYAWAMKYGKRRRSIAI